MILFDWLLLRKIINVLDLVGGFDVRLNFVIFGVLFFVFKGFSFICIIWILLELLMVVISVWVSESRM